MILVTGANGFIGRHFNFDDDNFRRVVRLDKKKYRTDFCILSLDSSTDWSGAFNGIESIIHLAGVAHSKNCLESDYFNINLEGTLRLANEAQKFGVKRFVFVSSILVNGASSLSKPFSFKDEVRPHSVNASLKRETEIKLLEISKQTGLEVVIVRPTLVYGPNAPGNFGLLVKLMNKFPVFPFGLAENRKDFISVQNLVDLLILCSTHKNASGHMFLASESETVSIKEFTDAIAKGLGKKIYQLPVPVSLMRFAGKLFGKSAMVEQLFGNLQVDSSCLKKVLGWSPPYTMEESMTLLKEHSKER